MAERIRDLLTSIPIESTPGEAITSISLAILLQSSKFRAAYKKNPKKVWTAKELIELMPKNLRCSPSTMRANVRSYRLVFTKPEETIQYSGRIIKVKITSIKPIINKIFETIDKIKEQMNNE